MAKLIDGKMISAQIKEEVKEACAKLKEEGKEVTLAVIQVGNDPASSVYVGNKKKACEYVGFRSLSYELAEETTEQELLDLISDLNNRADVDGFHAVSVGHLWIGKEGFVSCTPAGIIELLKRSDIDITGKECVVVGRSNIVGKPMAALMLRENATVTVCHSRTADLKEVTKRADILIVAIGKPQFITAEYVKPGATVIDVGIHRLEGKKLCGDVAFDEVEPVAGAITPVPGGVGPMTIAMLMKNCLEAALRK